MTIEIQGIKLSEEAINWLQNMQAEDNSFLQMEAENLSDLATVLADDSASLTGSQRLRFVQSVLLLRNSLLKLKAL